MPARAVSLLLLVAAGLAGCSGDGGGEGTSSSSSSEPPPPPPEDDNAVVHITFDAQGPATLEVPLPHIDSCRPPEAWMAGTITGTAIGELRDAGDGRTGRVLALSGEGNLSWSSQIEPGPQCQTIRYDPWSTDPDPEGEMVEVRVASGTVTFASVIVRLVRDTCGNATLYDEGTLGDGWSTLRGRSLPTSCG